VRFYKYYLFHFFLLVCSNMSGFNASAHGRHRDEDAAMPVVRAELNQLQESLMRAMEAIGLRNNIALTTLMASLMMKIQWEQLMTTILAIVEVVVVAMAMVDIEEVLVGVAFTPVSILMMKIFMKFMIMIWNIMAMRPHLPIMGHLDSTMTIIDVLPMVVMNCLIIIIELNQIILLESS
jgi:hypothetical protein